MVDVNITRVYLLDVPLENDYKNTLYFTSLESQQAYFQSKVVKSYTDFSYQRKDRIIRIPEQYDSIYHVNYVMYQNSAYSNKWFYAFITDLRYVNDGMTEAVIETDVIQTWLFDYTIKPSFVEREHVDDDTLGLHTVPEQLETGDYIVNSHYIDQTPRDLLMVMASTVTIGELDENTAGKYNGIPSGVVYTSFSDIRGNNNSLQYAINTLEKGKADSIVGLFLAPRWLVGNVGLVSESDTVKTYNILIDRIASLNGYTPRNNKLLTYPYCYVEVSNAQGQAGIYRQEVWQNTYEGNKMCFKVDGALTPGCSIRGYPVLYNGSSSNFDEGITMGKFPQLNWTTDQYVNWLTQNAVNIGVNLGTSMATNGAIAGVPGVIAGGIMGVLSSAGEIYKHRMLPPQFEGNLNSGDVATSNKSNTFHVYRMTIRQEYAKIIDKFFDMFGYKVNMVKTPNKAHRARWWYTKTIDINIDGAIPQDDMGKIKNAYNNGITFWRNASEIQNYDLSNGIV